MYAYCRRVSAAYTFRVFSYLQYLAAARKGLPSQLLPFLVAVVYVRGLGVVRCCLTYSLL